VLSQGHVDVVRLLRDQCDGRRRAGAGCANQRVGVLYGFSRVFPDRCAGDRGVRVSQEPLSFLRGRPPRSHLAALSSSRAYRARTAHSGVADRTPAAQRRGERIMNRLLSYFAGLTNGRIVLWSYLIWYLVTVTTHFDPTPRLWLTSLGLSAIIGTALLIST